MITHKIQIEKMDAQNNTFTLKKIQQILEYVWKNPHSSFYKDKYRQAGIISLKKIHSFEDFEKFPFLTKDEILGVAPDGFCFFPKNKIKNIAVSSGTTNKNKPTVIYCSPLAEPTYMKHQEMYRLKIKSLMILHPILSAQKRYRKDINFMGNRAVVFLGDIHNLEASASIASQLKIDSIRTTPTILYHFISHFKKEYDLSKIRLISLGGEYCSEQKAKFFKNIFKNAYFEFAFGAAETNRTGYRCSYQHNLAPRFFHGSSKVTYYETINYKGQNEMVVTSLIPNESPLIRYRTGDAVRFFEKKCPCGENLWIEVLGKLEHDAAKFYGALIYTKEIYKTLVPFTAFLETPDFKLHLFEEEQGDTLMPRLKLQLVLRKKIKDKEKMKEAIQKGVSANLFVSTKLTLSDLVAKGVFLPMEVEFVDSFPFELKHKHIISHVV